MFHLCLNLARLDRRFAHLAGTFSPSRVCRWSFMEALLIYSEHAKRGECMRHKDDSAQKDKLQPRSSYHSLLRPRPRMSISAPAVVINIALMDIVPMTRRWRAEIREALTRPPAGAPEG